MRLGCACPKARWEAVTDPAAWLRSEASPGEGAVEAGDEVTALVLDVNKKESIVDLSFLSHLVAAKGKKKSSKPGKVIAKP